MKANLHWIKKLLQVSFVPAEIRPGKSRPEIYIWYPPQKKPTSLHVLLVFAPVVWLCQKKTKNLEKTKIKNNIPGLLQKQKSKKPRENQKNQKKQYSRTLAKVKMQKSKKPRENQKNPKNQKKTIFPKSGDRVNRQESWNIVFFVVFGFFWFSRGFLDFCIFTFARVLEYCFFCFFWFSRGVLDFCFCKSPGILFFFGFLEVF